MYTVGIAISLTNGCDTIVIPEETWKMAQTIVSIFPRDATTSPPKVPMIKALRYGKHGLGLREAKVIIETALENRPEPHHLPWKDGSDY